MMGLRSLRKRNQRNKIISRMQVRQELGSTYDLTDPKTIRRNLARAEELRNTPEAIAARAALEQ